MKSALILSPFATVPLDAGHRRRTFQTTQMLRDQGYRITFLLYAFEDAWLWKHQTAYFDTLKSQWDEVIVVAGDHKPGAAPQSGADHRLDEWWNATLEVTLVNLFARRFFEVFVVHNVWLSKAFDYAPRSTVKVLETHDIFWRRRPILAKLGIANDFFIPDEASEIFGINRADIAIAIQEEDARYLLQACTCRVVTIPFYDPALEAQAPRLARAEYLYKEKVVFGFLGSRHIFNVRGLQALVVALERLIGESFAPVDIVVGGTAADAITTHLPLRRLGRVPSEVDFYQHCDIAIAPTFAGTGFKIKVGDCLALRLPLLCAAHSAIGTALGGQAVHETPAEMAAAMVAISLARPALAGLREEVNQARQKLKRNTALGITNFERVAARLKTVVVIEASRLTFDETLLALFSFLACAREIGQEHPVCLIVEAALAADLDPVLPPGVAVASPGPQADLWLRRSPKIVIDATGAGAAALSVTGGDAYLCDDRWDWTSRQEAAFNPAADGLKLPYFHDNHRWEPTIQRLRRRWAESNPERFRMVEDAEVLIFKDLPPDAAGRQTVTLQRKFLVIDAAQPALVAAAIMHILQSPAARLEVICACERPVIKTVTRMASASSRQTYHGTIDGIFKTPVSGRFIAPRPRPAATSAPRPVVTSALFGGPFVNTPFPRKISIDGLLKLQATEFVEACYEEILGKPVDNAGLKHYLAELARGVAPTRIIRHLANNPEAVARSVRLTSRSLAVDHALSEAEDMTV